MSVTYIVGTPDFNLKGRYDCLNSRLFPSLGSVFDVLRVPLFEGLDLRDLFMDFQLFYSFGKRGHRAITCCMLAFHNFYFRSRDSLYNVRHFEHAKTSTIIALNHLLEPKLYVFVNFFV